ncbi:MAG: hypothetical protein ACLFUJ_00825 [Phycisphaerae bacterium]
MNRFLSFLNVALDLAAAYRNLEKPRKPRIAADIILLAFSGMLLLTFLGFSIAAVFLALAATLSEPIAALLTGVGALAVAVIAFAASRWVMQDRTD